VVLEQPPVLPAAVAQAAYLELWQQNRRLEDAAVPRLTSELQELTALRHASMERRTQLRELLDSVAAESEGLRRATLGI
jgi:hypothetical protein